MMPAAAPKISQISLLVATHTAAFGISCSLGGPTAAAWKALAMYYKCAVIGSTVDDDQ